MKKVKVVSIRRPKELSHRSRRKMRFRSEESLNQQKIESSKIVTNIDEIPSTRSNISPDMNHQVDHEKSSPRKQQISTDKNIDLGTIDDILIQTKKPKKNSSFFSKQNPIHCAILMIVLPFVLVCAIVIPTMLLLYPTTTSMTTSSSTVNTTTTSITTRTTTSTSTSTAATVSDDHTAIATTTRIAFAFRGRNGYYGLDDVSIRHAASPTTEILINGGFEMGNLTGWGICDQCNTSTIGGVKNNATNFSYLGLRYYARTGSFYYVGGTSNVTDYISQTFSTIVGNLYWVTFAGMSGVNGSMASADFFLGV